MSTLLEALSSNTYDLQNKRDLSTNFSRDLIRYRGNIVDSFLENKDVDLNQKISEIAKASQLNDEQIKRLIEEVNNQVYLILYNRMRENKERNVSFNLATFEKVKEFLDQKVQKTSVKTAGESGGQMEKTASEEGCSNSWLFNGATSGYGNAESFAIEQDKFGYTKHACRKIADDYSSLEKAIEKNANETIDNAMVFANSLVKYSTMQKNANEIFETVCKNSNLSTECQKFLIAACQESIQEKTASYKLPEDYKLNISFCNPKNENDFSLNDFSLSKEAFLKNSDEELPDICEQGVTIHGLKDLVKIAEDVSESVKKARCLKEKKESYDIRFKEAGLSFEDVDKMGKYGKSWGLSTMK